ncbi:MAG: PepSY domain-containing protein [Limisphaerales bacterium]
MKIKMIACSTLAATLLTGCVIVQNGGGEDHNKKCEKCEHHGEQGEKGEKGEAKNKEANQTKLMSEAKITKEAAEQTALGKAPNGALKECELEKENGKLIWSFGFTTPDTTDITEVNVNAITGDVVNVEKESAASEAKEADEDATKAKQKEKGGDND